MHNASKVLTNRERHSSAVLMSHCSSEISLIMRLAWCVAQGGGTAGEHQDRRLGAQGDGADVHA